MVLSSETHGGNKMSVKRRDDGHSDVVWDHRDSPGIAPELLHAFGVPSYAHDYFAKGVRAELKRKKCWHCERGIILNPMRRRDRNICAKCDHYICDECALSFRLTGICYPWNKREEDALRANAKREIEARLGL